MTTYQRRPTLAVVVAILISALCTACLGPGWTDKDDDIVTQLKIEIPESATNIVGHPKGIDFFMPNDQWRAYVVKYYPSDTMSTFPYETVYEAPAECIPAFRSGVKLVAWVTGDEVQYRKSGRRVHRSVNVTPDCESGKAYVRWRLSDVK